MPGYSAWGLLTKQLKQAMNPLCVCYGATSTGVGDADAAAKVQSNSHSNCLVHKPQSRGGKKSVRSESIIVTTLSSPNVRNMMGWLGTQVISK